MAQKRQTRRIEGDGQTLVNLQYDLRIERDGYLDSMMESVTNLAGYKRDIKKRRVTAAAKEKKKGTSTVTAINQKVEALPSISELDEKIEIEKKKYDILKCRFEAAVQDINLVEAQIRRSWNEAHRGN